MVTAYGADEARKAGSGAGASAFLDKPVSQSRLWDTLIGIITPQLAKPRLLPNQSESQAALTGVRVLLVEDNEINQDVALGLLADGHFVVELAGNGREALARLASASYDIVLMDLQMPVLDGFGATAEIRAQPQFAELPIVAMTANAMAGDRERCLAAGMNDHVAKPLEPAQLYRSLLRWVPPRAAANGARSPRTATPATGERLPQTVPGIDLDEGLRRALGKEAFYLRLLRKFVDTQRGFSEELRQRHAGGDYPTAERLAHTLKGMAGNLGANALSAAAGELEIQLGQAPDSAEAGARVGSVCQQLDALLEDLRAALPAAVVAGPAARLVVDPTQLANVLGRLRGLLDDGDADAIELIETQAALLEAAFPTHFARIDAAAKAFDFDGVAAALTQAEAASG
jgi:CheY-like chemotaxis protein